MSEYLGYICPRDDRQYDLTTKLFVWIMDYAAVPFAYLTIFCPCGIFHTLPSDYAVTWAEEAGYRRIQLEGWPPSDIECLDGVDRMILEDWSGQLSGASPDDIYTELES